MATWLKVSTAIEIKLGPFVDQADGFTAETTLTIAQADVRLAKNAGDWAQKAEATTLVHEENGWYRCLLDTTDTNTLGILIVAVNESGALPVWREFLVVPSQVWDSYLGADLLQVHAAEISNDLITASAIAANAIGSAEIADGAITAAKFAAGAIDATAIAANAIGSAEIADGAITAAKFAAGAIDAAAIATDAIGAAELADGAITAATFAAGAIDNTAFNVTETLTANPAAGGIVAASFGAGAIDAAAIAADAIGASELAADAVTEIQAGLSTVTMAQVNAEVLDVLNVDTFAEIGQETPAATQTIRKMLAYVYKAWRNRHTQTSTTFSIYNDDGTTVAQKATVSDDGTTFDRTEITTGP